MIQKKEAENQAVKERFEFVLTVNNNIICQRYFKIYGFNEDSLGSLDLINTLNKCAFLIENDLIGKSRMYYHYINTPQVFNNKDEMNNWLKSKGYSLIIPSLILLRDTESTYLWDGEKAEPYTDMVNKYDFIGDENIEESASFIKLAFLDNGREVCSKLIDISQYPKFVRVNIDLSNSKNKYKDNGIFAPVESALIDILKKDRKDLIPIISREFCLCCSKESDEYTTVDEYGSKEYDLLTYPKYEKYIKQLGHKLTKKTEKYLASLN